MSDREQFDILACMRVDEAPSAAPQVVQPARQAPEVEDKSAPAAVDKKPRTARGRGIPKARGRVAAADKPSRRRAIRAAIESQAP